MNEIEISKMAQDIETKYFNKLQLRASVLDTNILVARVARGTGKTEGIMTPRIIRVADAMPGELSFFSHKTYVALLSNIIPSLRASFAQLTSKGTPLLAENIDVVFGQAKLPSHFRKPYRPISFPKHSIVFRNGHSIQLVSSDQPESVAGASGVHLFAEEGKHQDGKKIKARIIPALRGGTSIARASHYYQGMTIVSDAARLDMGEDDWIEDFAKNSNNDRLNDIATIALHIDKARLTLMNANLTLKESSDPFVLDASRELQRKMQHRIDIWLPILTEIRANSTAFLTASSFANKDILGVKYFRTQYETLSPDEFLSSICNIVVNKATNMFFCNFDKVKHTFSDSYKYSNIMQFGINDNFHLSAFYLKHFIADESLLLGYDPGHFSSLVVGQQQLGGKIFRLIKNFSVYHPSDQAVLARDFDVFFGNDYNKLNPIKLYYDRAGNKRIQELDKINTDAKLLKKELEAYGYRVELMNEGQRTIYYYEHYKLLAMIFSDKYESLPNVLIDENECSDLISSILISPISKRENKIELDKKSETLVPLHRQAALTTQMATALMYLLFGLYSDNLPDEFSKGIELVDF